MLFFQNKKTQMKTLKKTKTHILKLKISFFGNSSKNKLFI